MPGRPKKYDSEMKSRSIYCSQEEMEDVKEYLAIKRSGIPLYDFQREGITIFSDKCPVCHKGNLMLRRDRNGQYYYCCTNNEFWEAGEKNCSYRSYKG